MRVIDPIESVGLTSNPTGRPRIARYDQLANLLIEYPGMWIEISRRTVTGLNLDTKQAALRQAMRNRGLHIITRTAEDHIYVCLTSNDDLPKGGRQ